jgi:hypothetical protein
MKNETNLQGEFTIGRHRGHYGELFDRSCEERFNVVIDAIEQAEQVLVAQIYPLNAVINLDKPKTTSTQNIKQTIIPKRVDTSVGAARQAVIEVTEQAQQGLQEGTGAQNV